MFDLPEPFGPTITDTPGVNSSRVRSGNDLKPFRVIDLRCIVTALQASSSAVGRRGLLGVLLRAPGAARRPPRRRPSPPPRTVRSCGGPVLRDDRRRRTTAPRRASRSCSADLKSAGALERLLDLRRERLDHRLGGPSRSRSSGSTAPITASIIDGQHALGRAPAPRSPRAATSGGAASRSRSGSPSRSRDRPAGAARDRLRADLGQPAGAVLLGLQPRIQVRGDRQAEHRVAQEREPLVGVGAAARPRTRA